MIAEFVESWIIAIEDLTPRVRTIHDHLMAGRIDKARRLLPPEKVYPVDSKLGRRLKIGP